MGSSRPSSSSGGLQWPVTGPGAWGRGDGGRGGGGGERSGGGGPPPDVDILAHPGLITREEAEAAARNGVLLELSAKPSHGATNGHVARMARLAGARLIVDSDNHSLEFLTAERARRIVLGAGLEEKDVEEILRLNPQLLLERLLAERAQRPA